MAATKTKPEKAEESKLNLPSYYSIWAVIFLLTLITATLSIAQSLFGIYYSNTSRDVICMLLLMTFSVSLMIGLIKQDKKLLYATGLIEFIILLLPLSVFSWQAPYLPYNLSVSLMLTFPVLWVLLPIGLLLLTESRAARKNILVALLLLSIILFFSWTSKFTMERTCTGGWCLMGLLAMWVIPLTVWYITYLRLNRPLRKAKRPEKGILGLIRSNAATSLLLMAVVGILIFGYLIATPTYPQMCGDGICSHDESGWCYEDCGTVCGDHICSYSEDRQSCPTDCGEQLPPEAPGKEFLLQLDQLPSCELEVKLYDQDGLLLSVQQGMTDHFTFVGLDAESVYATIEGLGSQAQVTPIILLPGFSTMQFQELLPDLCGWAQHNGVLSVKIVDVATNATVGDASITVLYSSDDMIAASMASGEGDFVLQAGRSYYLKVMAPGYEDYDGSNSKFFLGGGDTFYMDVPLSRIIL